jgi:hypothetical protein
MIKAEVLVRGFKPDTPLERAFMRMRHQHEKEDEEAGIVVRHVLRGQWQGCVPSKNRLPRQELGRLQTPRRPQPRA